MGICRENPTSPSFLQPDYCCEGLICERHQSPSFFNELSFPAAVLQVWSMFRRPVFILWNLNSTGPESEATFDLSAPSEVCHLQWHSRTTAHRSFLVLYDNEILKARTHKITHAGLHTHVPWRPGQGMIENKGSHDSQTLARSNWLRHHHNNWLRQSLVLHNAPKGHSSHLT